MLTDGVTSGRVQAGVWLLAENRDTPYDGSTETANPLRERTTIHVLPSDGEPRIIYSNVEHAYLGGLSADQKLLCFHHSEHGELHHDEGSSGTLVASWTSSPRISARATR